MPSRRRASDDEAWADATTGECAIGSIAELREASPPGRPFEPQRGPLGFCVDPAAYRVREPKRRRKVVAARRADP